MKILNAIINVLTDVRVGDSLVWIKRTTFQLSMNNDKGDVVVASGLIEGQA